MKSAKPPVVPTWLLERIGSDSNDAVLGDLIEQYGAGRSRFWYWRQALATVLFSATRDIRAYKLLAFRALVSGWILYVAFSFPVNWVSNTIRPRSRPGWWVPDTPRSGGCSGAAEYQTRSWCARRASPVGG